MFARFNVLKHGISNIFNMNAAVVMCILSVACPLSAFMLDLSQLKRMLDVFTGHSLCLIDEVLHCCCYLCM